MTWVVGDIHGCAEELAELLERLALGPEDRVIALGDLYHRGPDPGGVARLLADVATRTTLDIVLGNHERVLLTREDGVLDGDGDTPMAAVRDEDVPLLTELLRGRPYFLRGNAPDGQPWLAVHAGVLPGVRPEDTEPFHLTRTRRLDLPGRPAWHEAWQGPELVLYGHTTNPFPRATHHGGRLVALGLDTGCVYGGALTAYRIEDGELESVPARRRYVD